MKREFKNKFYFCFAYEQTYSILRKMVTFLKLVKLNVLICIKLLSTINLFNTFLGKITM